MTPNHLQLQWLNDVLLGTWPGPINMSEPLRDCVVPSRGQEFPITNRPCPSLEALEALGLVERETPTFTTRRRRTWWRPTNKALAEYEAIV